MTLNVLITRCKDPKTHLNVHRGITICHIETNFQPLRVFSWLNGIGFYVLRWSLKVRRYFRPIAIYTGRFNSFFDCRYRTFRKVCQ